MQDWSLTSLRDKLIKIGAKVVSHGWNVAFQMAEVAILRRLFVAIVERIAALRPPLMLTSQVQWHPHYHRHVRRLSSTSAMAIWVALILPRFSGQVI